MSRCPVCGEKIVVVGGQAKYCPYCGSTLSDETRIYALHPKTAGDKVFVNNYDLIRGLFYSREFLWVDIEYGKAWIGITDYAQKQLHEIVFVELPSTHDIINQSEPFGTVESVKAVSDFIAPLSGMIEAVNEEVQNKPELLNEDPYGEGWLVVVSPTHLSGESRALMDFHVALQWYRQLQ